MYAYNKILKKKAIIVKFVQCIKRLIRLKIIKKITYLSGAMQILEPLIFWQTTKVNLRYRKQIHC